MNAAALPMERTRSARYLAQRQVPIIDPKTTASAALALLANTRFEYAGVVTVCDGERFVGLITMEELLSARSDAVATALLEPNPPVVDPDTSQEMAALLASQQEWACVAVVESDERFLGLAPPQRLLAVLVHEHDEDMARLGGFMRGSTEARHASEEPVLRRLWHRLPWLIIGLAGAVGAAQLVGGFERRCRRTLLSPSFCRASFI
jgi:magnesium transporter